jgi:predicted flap endonuclease-1-like 5' DNA nuclease
MASVNAIDGIGPMFAEKLALANIKSTERLLKLGGDRAGRKSISYITGIDETLILRWVLRVDLFRIKGIGAEYADLLEALGIESMKELSTRKADILYHKLIEVNEAKQLVRQLPTPKRVASWVSQARDLTPKVTY